MFTQDDLKRLAAVTGPCLTIFQPLRDTWSQVTKPETRIVAAIQEAGRLLESKGFGAAESEEMLRPLNKIAAHTKWSGRTGSFVMFRAPDFTMTSFWPDELAPVVHFAEEFLILPLLPGFQRSRDFWLLSLSIKALRLYRGNSQGLTEVPLPAGVPASLAQREEFDQPDHSLRGRSSAGPSLGGMKGVQFSTAAAHEGEPAYLHDFFRAVDKGIHPVLARDPHPLILAGVKRELAIYRALNTWSPLVAGEVNGNTEALPSDVLYAKAAEIFLEHTTNGTDVVLRDMDTAAGRGLLSQDPTEVLQAAGFGQVADLIVAPSSPKFSGRRPFINWAALGTIRNGGRVRFVKGEKPAEGVAAILRYRKTAEPAGLTSSAGLPV